MSDQPDGPSAEVTWVDLFPWLASARAHASIRSETWRHSPISDASFEERASFIEACARQSLSAQRVVAGRALSRYARREDHVSWTCRRGRKRVRTTQRTKHPEAWPTSRSTRFWGIRNMGLGTLEAVLARLGSGVAGATSQAAAA